jgi:uncharacterized membrane protein
MASEQRPIADKGSRIPGRWVVASEEASPVVKGPVHDLEAHVAALLGRRTSRNLNVVQAEAPQSLGERLSDRLTTAAGSWSFILGFLGFLAVWMVVNAVAGIRHWDPYPFILLNLVLSCVAAIQAPVILMSQNREEARDRLKAEADYEVNLKAEVLLEHLTAEVEMLKSLLRERAASDDGRCSGRVEDQ